jgi:hypothetical protein
MNTAPVSTAAALSSYAFECVSAANNPNLSTKPAPTVLDMEYVSTIMLPMRGQFVQAKTVWSPGERRWITSFTWLWLNVAGFTHKWIEGDPVTTNGVAWVRKDADTDVEQATPIAHHRSVQHFIKCAEAHMIPAATYMGRDIPNLFGPPRYEVPDKSKSKSKEDLKAQVADLLNQHQDFMKSIQTPYTHNSGWEG